MKLQIFTFEEEIRLNIQTRFNQVKSKVFILIIERKQKIGLWGIR